MRLAIARVAAFCLFYCAEVTSHAQTTFPVPPSGDQGAPRPLVVDVRPGIAPPSPEANRKRSLADLQELLTETQILQRDLQSSQGATVSAESFKRSRKIETLSKRIRKTLKAN